MSIRKHGCGCGCFHGILSLILSLVIIAAVVLTYLPEVLRSINNYRMLMYAIVLIVMMICTSNETIRSFFVRNIEKFKGLFKKNKAQSDVVKEGE